MNKILSLIFDSITQKGEQEKKFLKGAASSFFIKAGGAALAFFAQVVLARLLGVTDYGAYIYIYSWLTVLVIPTRLGFDNSLIRFIPEYLSSEKWNYLKGILFLAYKLVILFSVAIAFLILLGVVHFDEYLNSYSLELITYGLLTLPVMSLLFIVKSTLRGFKKIISALVPQLVLVWLFIIIGCLFWYFFYGTNLPASGAMKITFVAFACSLILSIYYLVNTIPKKVFLSNPAKNYRYWLRISIPMLMITGMNIILKRTDLLMIGSFVGQEATGIYGAVSKVSELVVFGLTAVDIIAAPIFSELYHSKKKEQLQKLATLAARVSFGLSIVITVFFGFASNLILGLFGEGFTSGHTALIILLVAQLLNAFFGSVGVLMIMSGYQNITAKILGIAAIINIILNLILIPQFGIEGGAIATGISMILWNVGLYHMAKRTIGIKSSIFD